MDEPEEDAEIDVVVETELIDVDGDGVIDAVTETTTTVIDVDGDGVADIVQQTTTTAYDIDGDGEVDLVESTTVTGVDMDGDGEFGADEVEIDETIAVSEDLVDELEEAEAADDSE